MRPLARRLSRRTLVAGLAVAPLGLTGPAVGQGSAPAIVVVGGGFAGATAARALQRGGCKVTLVEPKERYFACPFSNLVIAGLRPMNAQVFGYDALRRDGVHVVHAVALTPRHPDLHRLSCLRAEREGRREERPGAGVDPVKVVPRAAVIGVRQA